MKPVLSRVLSAALAIVGALTLVFMALRIAPGDPADNILGDEAPETAKREFRQRLHLDRPLLDQFGLFWSDVANGSLGLSYGLGTRDQTVAALIAAVMPATVELALAAMLIAILVSVPIGVAAAVRQGRLFDQLAMMGSLIGVAMPVFWSGPLLLFLFTVQLPILPDPGAPLRGPLPLILPALVLGAALSAKLTRMVRASVLDVMREDYAMFARAKGLPERTVVWKHVVRNALIPVLTVMGFQIAALLSGAVVTEKVFARPGIGTLLMDAIVQRDYAVVQGCVLVVTVSWVIVNLAVDLAVLWVDPRVRKASL